MATYKSIKGSKMQSFASDPSNLTAGQVWYNTTIATLKFYNGSTVKTVTTD